MENVIFTINDDTCQVVANTLLIWKGQPDHKPDHEIDIEDIERMIVASGWVNDLIKGG